MVVVNGIGCYETGAEKVLVEAINGYREHARLVVFCTPQAAKKVSRRDRPDRKAELTIIAVPHLILGRLFRVPFEFLIGLFAALRPGDLVVNFSHYGWCFSRNYHLLIHSPLLMDEESGIGWSRGRPNWVKRGLLNTCLRRAGLIVLQTERMRIQMLRYLEENGMRIPAHKVAFPRFSAVPEVAGRRIFQFQLFYPASPFPHKRVDLAIAATKLAFQHDPTVGLVVTTKNVRHPAICATGAISADEVAEFYRGSDALVFTSETETLGLPLLEALSIGMPIIAPNLPYATELLGSAACYYDRSDPDSISSAITRCKAELDTWRERSRLRGLELAKHTVGMKGFWELLLNAAHARS